MNRRKLAEHATLCWDAMKDSSLIAFGIAAAELCQVACVMKHETVYKCAVLLANDSGNACLKTRERQPSLIHANAQVRRRPSSSAKHLLGASQRKTDTAGFPEEGTRPLDL